MIFGDFGVTRGFASGSSKENVSKLSLLAKAFERVAQHMTPRDFSVQTRESLSSDGLFGRSFCLWFFALHWGDPFKDIRTSTPPWKNLTMEPETSVRRFLDQVVRSKFGGPRWRRNLKGLSFFSVTGLPTKSQAMMVMCKWEIRNILIKQCLEFWDLDERIT